jgi:hypothetical protein
VLGGIDGDLVHHGMHEGDPVAAGAGLRSRGLPAAGVADRQADGTAFRASPLGLQVGGPNTRLPDEYGQEPRP